MACACACTSSFWKNLEEKITRTEVHNNEHTHDDGACWSGAGHGCAVLSEVVNSFSCLLLRRLASRRILQQLGVHFRGRKLHVFNYRPTNEAILHGLHVRKRADILHADREQLDVEVLIYRVQRATNGKICVDARQRMVRLRSAGEET